MKIKAKIKLAWLIPFVLGISCTESFSKINRSNSDQPDLYKQEEEVKATLIKMWEAIEKEDIELYASFIHPEFTQFGESDPQLKIGKDTEVAAIKEWIKNSSNIHTEMEDPIVKVKDGIAWIVYYWRDSGITDEKPFSSRGKSTRIFVKEKGRWLCIHGHYTLLP